MKTHSKMFRRFAIAATLVTALAAVAFAGDIKLGIGTVNASSLYLREKATTESKSITSAPKGDKVVIMEKGTEWYKVEYNQKVGYMYADFLDFDPIKNVELGDAKAEDSSVNIRSTPSTDGDLVDTLPQGEKAYIIGFNNGWYKVKYSGNTGYIRSDLLTLAESIPPCNGGNALESVISYAKQFLGTPYVWGGTTPKPGFDCSGFTQYVCRHFGVSIYRIANDQMKNGTSVSRSNLRTGDLVFFERTYKTTDKASHVGFYISDGNFIHAADAGIKISNLSETYYATRYIGARRVF